MSVLGITDVWLYAAAVTVFVLIPGPGMLSLLTASARGGARAGWATWAGLVVGEQLFILAAALGVAAALAAHPVLFAALQWAGVAYLAWIGLGLLRSSAGSGAPAPSPRGGDFANGVAVTLLNPKSIGFYVAFFPLFIDPHRQRGALTFLAMDALIIGISLVFSAGLIAVGHHGARRLAARPAAGLWLKRGAGVVLLGFALRLALGSQGG
ncbi:hypothetical protein ABB25_01340 [Stenotrophomonas koreensis]|uniref:Amino acid transporter LysE n=1 Tax=Stenotrophomonas koreensis TaxID=266128 RepID=A0A0R0C608_9GAMM|nr:LysE family transporter [Stenotrophomonas koreensis]KRG60456.1 hypothetical protein ABB25_01340 [Stenotrophomonas koreensis]